MSRKHGYWIAAWLVLVVVVGFLAFGQGRSGYYQAGPGWGHMGGGWGQMGNWGGGYRGEGGPLWRGMGPGMMGRGGYGPGWGDEGGWGTMGPNAAGMPGMGYGMYGMYGGAMMPWALPDLTPEQSRQLEALQNEPSGRLNTLAQQVWAAQATLMRLQVAEQRDWAAIRTAALALHDLQRQRLEAAIELQQKVDALLSDSQRKELARARRGSGWAGAQ
ncbi:Spy/CpxP family protein refolding chaperone [Hydrogenophaga sp. ZJX-1]|uniref:Spy/CpxP family protein refolding chaperone n=1 Tax=Hydrogenophaga sp. ZJX-1 TaxID=3404778 RepID=UPI003B27BD32